MRAASLVALSALIAGCAEMVSPPGPPRPEFAVPPSAHTVSEQLTPDSIVVRARDASAEDGRTWEDIIASAEANGEITFCSFGLPDGGSETSLDPSELPPVR